MRIYTKTGDKGNTSLYQGKRVSKTDLPIQTLGALDELNAELGLLLTEKKIPKAKRQILLRTQRNLFAQGARIAGAKNNTDFDKETQLLETEIDNLTANLTPLKAFILPGGCKKAALTHRARAICRRAERSMVTLSQKAAVDENQLKYLNRLSDYLFTLARFFNQAEGKKETLWH